MERKTINIGENMEMAESRTSCNQTKQRKTINIGENMETTIEIAGHPATKQWNAINSGESGEVADSRTFCNQTMEQYQWKGECGGG